ncbi:E3 SUMO-protein ligase ZBED1-like [Dendropsophus ebraccatus]|uniref:E3 SUMO-protein ligase ZBED1-like n=1 Tax=Dendropsophus ebraccatus TaxID=150705 RepID=UPI00383105A4
MAAASHPSPALMNVFPQSLPCVVTSGVLEVDWLRGLTGCVGECNALCSRLLKTADSISLVLSCVAVVDWLRGLTGCVGECNALCSSSRLLKTADSISLVLSCVAVVDWLRGLTGCVGECNALCSSSRLLKTADSISLVLSCVAVVDWLRGLTGCVGECNALCSSSRLLKTADSISLVLSCVAVAQNIDLSLVKPEVGQDSMEASGSSSRKWNMEENKAAEEVVVIRDNEEELLVPKKNSMSVVWTHFGYSKDDIVQKVVICKHCRKPVIASRGNTSNLFHHLEHNHIIQYEQCMAQKNREAVSDQQQRPTTSKPTKQQSIKEAFTNMTNYEKDSKRWKEITEAISYYIAKDMAPIATVEHKGFKRLMKTIDRRYIVPSRKYFSQTAIPNMYQTFRKKVSDELKTVHYFAATSDLWSSRTMEPYLSFTVHYIDDEWKLQNRCLETAYFPVDHTSEMIAQGIRNMISAWNFTEDNLVAITTDNGANIVKAVELNGWTRQQCFGHRLHLAIENALKDQRVERAIRVCKNIVSAFSYSWKKKKALVKAQEEMNLPQHKLKTACATRWGSMQMMTARVLEQKKAITQVLAEDRKSRHLVPSWADLDVLEAVNNALSPLMEFTDALSGEEYVTISFVKPILHLLNTRVLAETEEDVELTKTIKTKILQYLNLKFSDPITEELLETASFVDPRFKVTYISEKHVAAIQEKVKSEMESAATANRESTRESLEPPTSSFEGKKAKRSLGSFFKGSEAAPPSTTVPLHQTVEAELSSYLVSPLLDSEKNPLEWWRRHSVNFPLLSKVAKKYLCIPATSSSSERVFSSGGNIVTCLRSSLKPEKVNMLVFLSKNLE